MLGYKSKAGSAAALSKPQHERELLKYTSEEIIPAFRSQTISEPLLFPSNENKGNATKSVTI